MNMRSIGVYPQRHDKCGARLRREPKNLRKAKNMLELIGILAGRLIMFIGAFACLLLVAQIFLAMLIRTSNDTTNPLFLSFSKFSDLLKDSNL